MQNAGGRPSRPTKGGFWARGTWVKQQQQQGGRKYHHGARNGDPRWSPMMPRPPYRPPFNFQRFTAPTVKDQSYQVAVPNAGRRPTASGATSGQYVSSAESAKTAQISLIPSLPDTTVHQSFRDASSIPPPTTNVVGRSPQAGDAHSQPALPPSPRRNYAQSSEPQPSVPDHQNATTTPKSRKKRARNVDKFTPCVMPEVSLDSSLPTFDLQAQDVVQQCLLSPDGQRDVDRVVSDLRTLLRPIIPDNLPILYGSMATGLALETSDIDCFIESMRIPDMQKRVKLLQKNYRILGRRGTFQDLTGIAKARVPLVKAVHSSTGIEIDISCTSKAAIYNTRLVKRLVETDERIRPLIVLISICYRLNGLTGTNRFVSYTVVLLIFFYLQNLEIPMLPPLNKIITHLQDEQWPMGFSFDILSHLQAPNSNSLAELFSGFFKFYNSFDFSHNVVSTYMGQAIPVEHFSTPDILPDELFGLKQYYNEDPLRRNNFINRFIFVQDPMEHYINTISYLQLRTIDHFKKVNCYMVEMMGSKPEIFWLENMLKMHEELSVSELPNTNLNQNPDLFFNIRYPKDELSQEEWLLKLKKSLLAVFKLLLFDVIEVGNEPEAKVRISEGPVHNRTLMTFELRSSFNVYTKRFRGLPAAVVRDPRIFGSAGQEMSWISQRMKTPVSSIHCELSVKQPISPEEIPVQVRDINENPSNTYLHLSGMMRDNLTGLLTSAKDFEILGKGSTKEQNIAHVMPIVQKSLRSHQRVRFTISYKREENEEEEAWKSRLRVDLISLFQFLLLEQTDATSMCGNMDVISSGGYMDDESIVFGFRLKTPHNIFTKRFNCSYTRVLEDPSCIQTVASENAEKCSGVNLSTVGTFHGELHIVRSDFLSPHQLFVVVHDINENVHNNFGHYSSMLLQNFGGLLNSIKKVREAQSEKNTGDVH